MRRDIPSRESRRKEPFVGSDTPRAFDPFQQKTDRTIPDEHRLRHAPRTG